MEITRRHVVVGLIVLARLIAIGVRAYTGSAAGRRTKSAQVTFAVKH